MLPVTEANGGNCWACSRLRLFVAGPSGLTALAVDAPDFVVPQTLASVGNRRVLIANDVRWESFGDVCHACAPGVAVVLAWRNGRFEQACREAPDYYRQRLAELGPRLADRDPQVRFGAITSRLLIRIQIGEAEAARTEYRHALGVLRRLRGGPRNGFRARRKPARHRPARGTPAAGQRRLPGQRLDHALILPVAAGMTRRCGDPLAACGRMHAVCGELADFAPTARAGRCLRERRALR